MKSELMKEKQAATLGWKLLWGQKHVIEALQSKLVKEKRATSLGWELLWNEKYEIDEINELVVGSYAEHLAKTTKLEGEIERCGGIIDGLGAEKATMEEGLEAEIEHLKGQLKRKDERMKNAFSS